MHTAACPFPTRVAAAALVALFATGTSHADVATQRAAITGLADRYVAEFKLRYPLSYAFSGLQADRQDGVDINAPADLAHWRAFERSLIGELHRITPDAFAGQPEWVTWYFLDQALRQDAQTEICRSELWNVSVFGWQTSLAQLAGMQPVGSDPLRREALARWRKLPAWIDQEIANLKEGQKLGYFATQVAVRSVLGQLDGYVDTAAEKSGYLAPAVRDSSPEFAKQWRAAIETAVLPALRRYRDFLRDKYLPSARTQISLDAHPNGRQCYRALIFATTTIDADPAQLYDVAVQEVARERAVALELGKKIYGEKARDWSSLATLLRADPSNQFASKQEVKAYTQRTYERAAAAARKMVLTPPVGRVKLEPFPDYQQESAPGGQYLPAADDGSHTATYFYRDIPKALYRTSLQNVILHETLPGHHLQIALLAEHPRKGNHPIARLLFFSGPGEGWATYAEDFAYEIGLYDSDRDYIGRMMGSITPMMVADLGLQIKGWSAEQAAEYLKEAMPMRPPERAAQSVSAISGMPGFVLAYPLGGIEWQKMRSRAQAALGERFDVRAFHQMELEDGMLPFVALHAKEARWEQQEQ